MIRSWLVVVGVVGALSLAGSSSAQERQRRPGLGGMAMAPWRLGVQAYTFNRFTFFEAVDKAKELQLRFIEAYPGQKIGGDLGDAKFDHNMPVSVMAKIRNKLDEAGVRLVNYGVVGLGKDEAEARKVFDFAKVMGIETIVSEPPAETLEMLDRLAGEYRINVAIHNHPKPSMYWDPAKVLEAVKGRSPRIGACADTGHWARSGVKPIEALKMLEGRIITLHFKDLNKEGADAHDVPWGTGVCDVKGMLTELKRQDFRGVFSIEYEHNWENSVPEIAECVKYFRQVQRELFGPRERSARR